MFGSRYEVLSSESRGVEPPWYLSVHTHMPVLLGWDQLQWVVVEVNFIRSLGYTRSISPQFWILPSREE